VQVGIPTEVKDNEYRVAITPSGVHELTTRGHTVTVQSGAGDGSSIPDDEYAAAGARLVPAADDVWTVS
jgi:alanine dehydrogenase